MAANPRSIEARAVAELVSVDESWRHRDWEPQGRQEGLADGDSWPSLPDRFAAQLTSFSDEELEDAKQPHPHAFENGDCGLLPIGEVSVIAAPGREGKTFASIALSVAYVLGTKVVGLTPQAGRQVIIYSAEDDRKQYARKVLAQVSRLGREDAARVRERLIVPDLSAPGMEAFCALVRVAERRPMESLAIQSVIEALRPAMGADVPPGLLIFETASTLSEADEDNLAFKTMIKGLRRIARELGVAVVLVHHTSQQAASNLPDLNLGVADMRGGTALAFNARQCFLLVNLGSNDDPLPEQDARTVLREMAVPNAPGRVTALICLDSSKGSDPAPVFFRWTSTPYGPALGVVPVPPAIEGARWRKVHQMIRGERAGRRLEAKEGARQASAQQVVRIVGDLIRKDVQPTARAVSNAAGRSPTWAKPHLEAAVDLGDLVALKERVPRVAEPVVVYRLPHSTRAGQ